MVGRVKEMFYMLTSTEIIFIKDLINNLYDIVSDQGGYDSIKREIGKDIDLGLELLNRLEPIDTESVLDLLDPLEE